MLFYLVVLAMYASVARRKSIRNQLEKAIAQFEASNRLIRPVVWVNKTFYDNISNPLQPVSFSTTASCLGYNIYDSIDHHEKLLELLNVRVKERQRAYSERARSKVENVELRGRLEVETRNIVGFMKERLVDNVVNKFNSSREDHSTTPLHPAAGISNETIRTPSTAESESKCDRTNTSSTDSIAMMGSSNGNGNGNASMSSSKPGAPGLLTPGGLIKSEDIVVATSELMPRKVLAKVVGSAAAAAESGNDCSARTCLYLPALTLHVLFVFVILYLYFLF